VAQKRNNGWIRESKNREFYADPKNTNLQYGDKESFGQKTVFRKKLQLSFRGFGHNILIAFFSLR
jgi:hypothetical protein